MSAVLATQFVKTRPFGPTPCDVMVVGEAPGANEEIMGIPFVGASGDLADKLLAESGFIPRDLLKLPYEEGIKARRAWRDTHMFFTNACKYRPPENKIENFFLDSKRLKPNELIADGIREFKEEISRVQPKLIICFGDTPMWALTGNHGITKWRGSMLEYDYMTPGGLKRTALILPTFHPANLFHEWANRPFVVHDLRRAKEALDRGNWPKRDYTYLLRPSFTDTMDVLGTLFRKAEQASPDNPLPLSSDLETRAGYIACHGIAWSSLAAISIPSMCVERPSGYFTLDEDVAIWERERVLLTHPNVEVIGQNYLYDSQYFARRRGYVPRLRQDTMAMQHVAWPGLPKTVGFLSSMYCQHHVYWKEEGKTWEPGVPEEQLWHYNCEDASRTFEIRLILEDVLRRLNLWHLYRFQMSLFIPVLEMMLRGMKLNMHLRASHGEKLLEVMMDRQQFLNAVLNRDFNPRSPPQMFNLFYNELRCTKILSRKTKRPTCDEDALNVFSHKEPLLKCITQPIIDIRSLGAMISNIIQAKEDADGRLRSEFSPYQAESFRWVSRKNAWDGGTNLQNWTKGDEDKENPTLEHSFPVPNARKLLIPDSGFEIASNDLSGADAQTVAWEANDEDLKAAFRAGVKIHAHNARTVWPKLAPTGFEQPYYDRIRTGVHLVNYLGERGTLARAIGVPEWEAQQFIDLWFRLHPKIQDWHNRIQHQLETTHCIYNKFGYRRFYFDRVNDLLPEAIAWIGQSQTACVTNRAFSKMTAWSNIRRGADYKLWDDETIKLSKELYEMDFQMLLQVHDELVYQYPIMYREEILRRTKVLGMVVVPYDDPLIIPWGLKTSTRSWGECEKREWPN